MNGHFKSLFGKSDEGNPGSLDDWSDFEAPTNGSTNSPKRPSFGNVDRFEREAITKSKKKKKKKDRLGSSQSLHSRVSMSSLSSNSRSKSQKKKTKKDKSTPEDAIAEAEQALRDSGSEKKKKKKKKKSSQPRARSASPMRNFWDNSFLSSKTEQLMSWGGTRKEEVATSDERGRSTLNPFGDLPEHPKRTRSRSRGDRGRSKKDRSRSLSKTRRSSSKKSTRKHRSRSRESRKALRKSRSKSLDERKSPSRKSRSKSRDGRTSSRKGRSKSRDKRKSSRKGRSKSRSKREGKSKSEEDDEQRAESLKLQQQLSDALQKVVAITEEQIREKDEYLKVSTELLQLKGDFSDVQRERNECTEELEQAKVAVQTGRDRILQLEETVEEKVQEQESQRKMLEKKEDEYQKLFIENQDLRFASKETDGGEGTYILRQELLEARNLLVDKDREIESQKYSIEHLTKEMEDNQTVNRLQVDEMESEKMALEGKIKADRLDVQAKISVKDDMIATLQQELQKYKKDSNVQDLALVKAELESAQNQSDMATKELDHAEKTVSKLKAEKEDLLERNNALNEQIKNLEKTTKELTIKSNELGEKVLQWTEKTYDWKARAEQAEKSLSAGKGEKGEADSIASGGEDAQGVLLQSIMDKQKGANNKGGWGNIFNAVTGSEEGGADANRVNVLLEKNSALEDEIAKVKSEMVKQREIHRGELYVSEKKVAHLQGENDALVLKNKALEQLSTP